MAMHRNIKVQRNTIYAIRHTIYAIRNTVYGIKSMLAVSRDRDTAQPFLTEKKYARSVKTFYVVENFRMFEAGRIQVYTARQVRKFRADFFVPVFPILRV